MSGPPVHPGSVRDEILKRLAELGLSLPPAPQPVGSYVPCVVAGGLAYTSGQLPMRDGLMLHPGKVPEAVALEPAAAAAQQAALNALAALDAAVGLERVRRVVRLTCYVNSSALFTAQPKVANGASDLLVAVLGEAGRHTRCAVGVAELPLNACVEVDLIAQVSD